MDWLRKLRRPPLSADEGGEEADDEARSLERPSPGVAALFARLREDGSHVILDLGPASEAHLRLFRGYARKVRFAGLVPAPPRGAALAEALGALPPHPEQPYDVVLAWNILDLLEERERASLVERLEDLTAPEAALYTLTDLSEDPGRPGIRFTLTDLETVSQRNVTSGPLGGARLLPAQVERVLAPFEVIRGFTLRNGLREYVAVKSERRRGWLGR